MKKAILGLTCFVILLMLSGLALASGVTLRTYTPFADQDPAAQRYSDIIDAWGMETGNGIEDYSGTMDETFISTLEAALRDGSADVVILPVGTGIDPSTLIDVATLSAMMPDSGIREMEAFKENGRAVLAPVRFKWESLYVNTDVIEQAGLPVPATFEDLIIDCLQLSQMGIQPVANALCEWPEIVLDCTAMMGAPESAYGTQESLDGAASVLNSLVLVGAFGNDAWNVTDSDMEKQFLDGRAAMRFDTSDLASQIPEDRVNSCVVLALPGMDNIQRSMLVGLPDCGLAMTRACYEDPVRREAALSLINTLLNGDMAAIQGGTLGESICAMSRDATGIAGVLYDYNQENFEKWSEQLIAQLMSTASAAQ